MNSVDRAVEKCADLVKYHVSPFRCYYFNPHKYTITGLMKWTQKYMMNRMYLTLLKASNLTGYEAVPEELLLGHAVRDGFGGRKIRIGRLAFYMIRREEMSKKLLERYEEFKNRMATIGNSRDTAIAKRPKKESANSGQT